jgi:hypothetical protein
MCIVACGVAAGRGASEVASVRGRRRVWPFRHREWGGVCRLDAGVMQVLALAGAES